MTESRQVLVVPREQVAELYLRPAFVGAPLWDQISDVIRKHGRLVPRDWAELNPDVKQIVAVCVVRKGDKLLSLRRSMKASRAHMRLKHTLVIGGHVDDVDVKSAEDPIATCALRELKEEVGLDPKGRIQAIGCIADPSNESGNLHLAVLFDVEVDADSVEVRPSFDNSEFVRSSETTVWSLKPLAELRRVATSGGFDRWSTLFLQSHVARELLRAEEPIATPQRELGFA